MEEEKYIIPRNVLYKDDTFPVDFVIHFELEKRQIPYILVGGTIAIITFTNPTLKILYRIAIPLASLGSTSILSIVKVEGQHLENLLYNLVKYYGCKIKLKKIHKGEKNNDEKREKRIHENIKSGIARFAIKKS